MGVAWAKRVTLAAACVSVAAAAASMVLLVSEAAGAEGAASVGPGTCVELRERPGLGPGCARGAAWQLQRPDGRGHAHVHVSGDPAPDGGSDDGTASSDGGTTAAAPGGGGSPLNRNEAPAADPSSVACASSREAAYQVVYAPVAGAEPTGAELDAKLAQIRSLTWQAATHVRNRGAQLAATLTYRLKVRCDEHDAIEVRVAPISTEATSFWAIWSELHAQGVDAPDTNVLVYADYDDPWAAGRGTVGSPASTGQMSQIYAGGWYWEVALHEMLHNLGAVQLDSPNSSGAWHCNDDKDVMCYRDGGPNSGAYRDNACRTTVEVLDCDANDYFHPRPKAGSYLATHLNVAVNNRLLLVMDSNDAELPLITPLVTGWQDVQLVSPFEVSDDTELRRISYAIDGGAGVDLFAPIPVRPQIHFEEGRHELAVEAEDTSGRVTRVTMHVDVDVTAPGVPAVRASAPGRYLDAEQRWISSTSRVDATWLDPSDALSGIAGVEHCIAAALGSSCTDPQANAPLLAFTATGATRAGDYWTRALPLAEPLVDGALVHACVRATDAAGNVTTRCSLTHVVDAVAPDDPGVVSDGFDGQLERDWVRSTMLQLQASWPHGFGTTGSPTTQQVCISTSASGCSGDVAIDWADAGGADSTSFAAMPAWSLQPGVRYHACLRRTDAVGNAAPLRCSDGVTPDIDAPALAIQLPDTVTVGSTDTPLQLTGFDTVSGIRSALVSGTGGLPTLTTSVLPSAWMLAWPGSWTSPGTYVVTATATDHAGNATTVSRSITVVADSSDGDGESTGDGGSTDGSTSGTGGADGSGGTGGGSGDGTGTGSGTGSSTGTGSGSGTSSGTGSGSGTSSGSGSGSGSGTGSGSGSGAVAGSGTSGSGSGGTAAGGDGGSLPGTTVRPLPMIVVGNRIHVRISGAPPAGSVIERRLATTTGQWSAWRSVARARTGTSVTLRLAPGVTMCVRIRHRSRTSRPRCTTALLDGRSVRARGMRTVRHSYASGGTLFVTRSPGAQIGTARVRADVIALRAYACPDCGSVLVRINGRALKVVSTRRRDAGFVTIRVASFRRTWVGRIDVIALDRRVVRIDGIAPVRTRG